MVFSLDNMQLQSCNISQINDDILVMCQFSKMSDLWGCRAVATEVKTKHNYLSDDIPASTLYSTWGKIESVGEGEYLVRCYGLPKPNGTISYEDMYTSIINITRSQVYPVLTTNCVNSMTTIISTSLTPPSSSPSVDRSTSCKLRIALTVTMNHRLHYYRQ